MTKIQIDLSEEEDRIVEIYKLVNNLKTKQEAIKKMVKYFKADVKPRNLGKDEEYYKKAVDSDNTRACYLLNHFEKALGLFNYRSFDINLL